MADLDQPQALSVCALIELYRYFTTAYKISEHQINNPDIDSKQTIKVKANHSLDLGGSPTASVVTAWIDVWRLYAHSFSLFVHHSPHM